MSKEKGHQIYSDFSFNTNLHKVGKYWARKYMYIEHQWNPHIVIVKIVMNRAFGVSFLRNVWYFISYRRKSDVFYFLLSINTIHFLEPDDKKMKERL